MIRTVLLSFLLLLSASSCTEERPPMSEAELLPLIIELHLADAYSTQVRDTLHPGQDKNYDSLAVWTLRILKRHQVSQQDFSAGMDWFRDHPDRLQKLYEAAADSLERMRK